jgi:broad specificity phosphatase PhoE
MSTIQFNFIRHGHVDYPPGILIGQSPEFQLDELGEQQSYDWGEYQRRFRLYPDIVMTSPAERAIATAVQSLGTLGVAGYVPINIDHRLSEQSLGEHEKMPRDRVYTPNLLALIEEKGAIYRHPGGQSMLDKGKEMFAYLIWTTREAQYKGFQRVDSYSHNIAIASLLAYISGVVEPHNMHTYVRDIIVNKKIGNASRTLIVWENGNYNIKFIGASTAI